MIQGMFPRCTFIMPAMLLFAGSTILAQNSEMKQHPDTAVLADAPVVPQMVVDPDGTLHFGPRTVPLPALTSPQAKDAYRRQMLQRAEVSAAKDGLASPRTAEPIALLPPAWSKQAALKIYPVVEESQTIGGVGVTIYSPHVIPPKNRDKVVMEFEIDAEAIAVASLGQLKVIKVNYRGGGPSIPGNEDIVAVYRELLKTYKPKSIGMFGASGGCTLAQTTILWLAHLKIPLPGAVGLNTCSGGSNPGDSRYTMNGLDASLSSAFSGRPPFGGRNTAPRKPDDPPATALDGIIPKGYPPAFLLSGTRDMCLSETVLLHRKLRNAGVDADLNVFEGMWHVFWEHPELPEAHEAMSAEAKFFNQHLE
jgi:monoterpene epsilon-lactone hydrolase